MNYITSSDNNKIKSLIRLKTAHGFKKSDCFIAEGFTMLDEAIKSDADVMEVFLLEKYKDDFFNRYDLLEKSKINFLTEDLMKKVSNTVSSREVVFTVKKNLVKTALDEFYSYPDRLLFVEDISDPGNLGTIMRTAEAFGFNDIIITNNSASFFNDKVVRASMGAIFRLNLYNMSVEDIIELAKDYKLIATCPRGESEFNVDERFILALGNEARGLSESLLDNADYRLTIPMRGKIESLNLSVAAGISMYILNGGKFC
ncbi:MAG: RNA methyltransferase [Ezakiella sp.]|nr:RNA methyltransferase [Ezakiella sp.]